MIKITPNGGLCDRMVTFESTYLLAKQLNDSQLILEWKLNKELNCPFEELFQPIPTVSITNIKVGEVSSRSILKRIVRRLNKLYRKYIEHNEIINLDKLNVTPEFSMTDQLCNHYLKQRNKITINGIYNNSENCNFKLFKPTQLLEQKIDSIICLFSNDTIGVHLRRTDNLYAIKESPTSLFVEKMKAELRVNPDITFYVATDSEEELNSLIVLFGSRILYQKDCIRERNSINGIKSSLIDLYSLSATKVVWGSYWSAFSFVASKIENKKLLILRN